ncbi:MAG TPA: STAS domain-containing protein [Solirubrobacteraceae bacterium]|jgi:anti-anti-sigma factor
MAPLDGDRVAKVEIDTQVDPTGAPVVSLAGELDISNVGPLKAVVASVTADRPDQLIFELSGLRFIDSAGIAELLSAAAKVKAVHLRDPTPLVRRAVEGPGLSGVLHIEP